MSCQLCCHHADDSLQALLGHDHWHIQNSINYGGAWHHFCLGRELAAAALRLNCNNCPQPHVFCMSVQEHLTDVLPSILDGLADEAEGVRDAALAAGRTFVDLYAETALPLLLPAVEDGILNDNWRIRQSSVELLGQLLFKVLPHASTLRPANTLSILQ